MFFTDFNSTLRTSKIISKKSAKKKQRVVFAVSIRNSANFYGPGALISAERVMVHPSIAFKLLKPNYDGAFVAVRSIIKSGGVHYNIDNIKFGRVKAHPEEDPDVDFAIIYVGDFILKNELYLALC